jgi:hypothetical protein
MLIIVLHLLLNSFPLIDRLLSKHENHEQLFQIVYVMQQQFRVVHRLIFTNRILKGSAEWLPDTEKYNWLADTVPIKIIMSLPILNAKFRTETLMKMLDIEFQPAG